MAEKVIFFKFLRYIVIIYLCKIVFYLQLKQNEKNNFYDAGAFQSSNAFE